MKKEKIKHMYDDAIEFFSDEIKQIDSMLNGEMSKLYREYLTKKKEYYNLALRALEL